MWAGFLDGHEGQGIISRGVFHQAISEERYPFSSTLFFSYLVLGWINPRSPLFTPFDETYKLGKSR